MADNASAQLDAAIAALSAGDDSLDPVDAGSAFGDDEGSPNGYGDGKDSKAKARGRRNRARKPGSRVTKADIAEGSHDFVAGIGASIWGLGGMGIGLRMAEPIGPPVGRMMQIQAPAAGQHIANIIERTPLMKWLQPITENKGLMTDIAALLLPPMMIGGMAAKPELQGLLGPFFQALMVPLAKEIIEAQRDSASALGGLSEVDEETNQMVATIMAQLFGEPETE